MKISKKFHEHLINKSDVSKTSKTILVLAIMLLLTPMVSNAQGNQAFMVHEDQVKPGMVATYETISKEFNDLCKENDFIGNWTVAEMTNGKFLTLAPIKKLGDIDDFSFDELSEKVGKEKFRSYFERYDQCYDNHGSYVTLLNSELSYMPDGMSTTQEGKDYRKWHIIHVTPANKAKMAKKMKILKDHFAAKNSKVHYRVYTNGFGQMGDRFVVVVSAKDALDYAQMSAKNRTVLGPESKAKFDAIFNLSSKYEEVTGYMRPDLSYSNN